MKPLDQIGDLSHITVEVGKPLPVWAHELMDTLGVTVVVKPGAPTQPSEEQNFVDSHAKRFREQA